MKVVAYNLGIEIEELAYKHESDRYIGFALCVWRWTIFIGWHKE